MKKITVQAGLHALLCKTVRKTKTGLEPSNYKDVTDIYKNIKKCYDRKGKKMKMRRTVLMKNWVNPEVEILDMTCNVYNTRCSQVYDNARVEQNGSYFGLSDREAVDKIEKID